MNPLSKIREEKIQTVDSDIIVPRKAIISEENNVISVVGEGYQVVENSKLVEEFENYLTQTDVKFVRADIGVTGKRGQKFFAKYRFPEIKNTFGEVDGITKKIPDDVQLMMELHNSYDGSSKWGFEIGGYRLVCLNGLRMYESLFQINEMHNSSASDSNDVVTLGFQAAVDMFRNNLHKKWSDMKNLNFDEQIVATLVEKLEIGKRYSEILNRMQEERIQNGKLKTAWDFYNMVTWFTTHIVEQRNRSLATRISAEASRMSLNAA